LVDEARPYCLREDIKTAKSLTSVMEAPRAQLFQRGDTALLSSDDRGVYSDFNAGIFAPIMPGAPLTAIRATIGIDHSDRLPSVGVTCRP